MVGTVITLRMMGFFFNCYFEAHYVCKTKGVSPTLVDLLRFIRLGLGLGYL